MPVTVRGRRIDLTVSGIGLLPECLLFSRDGDIVTPAGDYGYACVSFGTLGFLSYEEIDVTLSPGADSEAVKREIQGAIDEDATTITLRGDVASYKNALEQISQLRLIGIIVPIVFFLCGGTHHLDDHGASGGEPAVADRFAVCPGLWARGRSCFITRNTASSSRFLARRAAWRARGMALRRCCFGFCRPSTACRVRCPACPPCPWRSSP